MYGLTAMVELGLHYNNGSMQIKDIARIHEIPSTASSRILVIMKKSGLVESYRGCREVMRSLPRLRVSAFTISSPAWKDGLRSFRIRNGKGFSLFSGPKLKAESALCWIFRSKSLSSENRKRINVLSIPSDPVAAYQSISLFLRRTIAYQPTASVKATT